MLAAGVAAGAINAVVGSGTLVTFPVLLALGYPPVVANASNTVGLVPGSLAGAYGYRAELARRRPLLLRLAVASLLGGIAGAALLLLLPASVFRAVVPVLIVLAVVLVVVQPWLARRLRRALPAGSFPGGALPAGAPPAGAPPAGGGEVPHGLRWLVLVVAVFATGVYGGYFGAAQGVLLLAILGVLVPDRLQRLNGIKNVLAGLVNAVAAVVFVATGHVSWLPAVLIAAGSVAGGLLGARFGRRLPDTALRAVIVAVGLAAVVRMVV